MEGGNVHDTLNDDKISMLQTLSVLKPLKHNNYYAKIVSIYLQHCATNRLLYVINVVCDIRL